MSDIDFELAFKQLFEKLDIVGEKYAKAKSISWQLQEMRKVLIADTMNKSEGTLVDRENEARTSSEYLNHIKGTSEAIHKEYVLKAEYEALYARFEALRSLCSQQTAQTKLV